MEPVQPADIYARAVNPSDAKVGVVDDAQKDADKKAFEEARAKTKKSCAQEGSAFRL